MQIQINSDKNVSTPENFSDYVRQVIEDTLSTSKDQITRVEVHLSDENGAKFGTNDKRCVLEARIEGRQPIAVTDHGETLHEVIDGAAEKLKHSLETIFGREFDKHRKGPLF